MEVLIIIVLLAVILGIWLVSTQRKLVMMDENINTAMSQIGVQLFSRFDALIGLLELTEKYKVKETSDWIEKTKLKRREIHSKSVPKEALEQENFIVEVLQFVDAAVKQCPEMKEDKKYCKQMDAMKTYERMLHTSYLIYNDSVAKFNQAIRMFPTKWIAGLVGFHERDFFETI